LIEIILLQMYRRTYTSHSLLSKFKSVCHFFNNR